MGTIMVPCRVCNMPVFPNTAMVNTLPILKHQFTHYTLYIHPVHVKLAESHLAYCGKWVSRDELSTIALPAPVKKIQQQFL